MKFLSHLIGHMVQSYNYSNCCVRGSFEESRGLKISSLGHKIIKVTTKLHSWWKAKRTRFSILKAAIPEQVQKRNQRKCWKMLWIPFNATANRNTKYFGQKSNKLNKRNEERARKKTELLRTDVPLISLLLLMMLGNHRSQWNLLRSSEINLISFHKMTKRIANKK